MASPPFLHLLFLLSLLLTSPHLSLSHISFPPSLPPASFTSSSDSFPPSAVASVSTPPALSPFASPPAPLPSSSEPASSPLSSPVPVSVPVPAPSHAELRASSIHAGGEEEEIEKKGLNGGMKAGVVVGVFAATALVGLGVLVCKRRQENIRRSRYGEYSSRVEMV